MNLNSSQTASNESYRSKFTSKQVFEVRKEELELVEYIKKCVSYQFGLTYKALGKLAYEYATLNEKDFPGKWNIMKEAGEYWLYRFMKRNPTLMLRKSEITSLERLSDFTKKKTVNEFCDNLKLLYEKHFFQAKLYNLDEIGITTVVEFVF